MNKVLRQKVEEFIEVYHATEKEKYTPYFGDGEKVATRTEIDTWMACKTMVDLVVNWVKEMNNQGYKKSQIYNQLKNIQKENHFSNWEKEREARNVKDAIIVYTRGEKLL